MKSKIRPSFLRLALNFERRISRNFAKGNSKGSRVGRNLCFFYRACQTRLTRLLKNAERRNTQSPRSRVLIHFPDQLTFESSRQDFRGKHLSGPCCSFFKRGKSSKHASFSFLWSPVAVARPEFSAIHKRTSLFFLCMTTSSRRWFSPCFITRWLYCSQRWAL